MAKESANYDAICRSIIERGAWDKARRKVNPRLYAWIQKNKDTNPYSEQVASRIEEN